MSEDGDHGIHSNVAVGRPAFTVATRAAAFPGRIGDEGVLVPRGSVVREGGMVTAPFGVGVTEIQHLQRKS